jgi:hypothetical protein
VALEVRRKRQVPARLRYPHAFGQGGGRVVEVVDAQFRDNQVEGARREGQERAVGGDQVRVR